MPVETGGWNIPLCNRMSLGAIGYWKRNKPEKSKKLVIKEAYLKRSEISARKALDKSKAEIEEGLTTSQCRRG